MAKLIPKSLQEDSWIPLEGGITYGLRSNKDETVYIRFGPAHGVYISAQNSPDGGRVVQTVDFETGNPSPLSKIPETGKLTIGRATTCDIKIMHAIMSRAHLEVRLRGNVLIVKDMGSTNKTFIFKETKYFDIEKYIQNHPLEQAAEGTLDSVRETFGPALTDLLKIFLNERDK